MLVSTMKANLVSLLVHGTCHANLHWHEGPSIGSAVFFSIFDTFLVKILYTLTKFHSPLKLDVTVVV